MAKYRMQVYIGTRLADGFLILEADSLDDAEAKAAALLATKEGTIAMNDDQGLRRVYFNAAITGFIVSADEGAKRKIGLLS